MSDEEILKIRTDSKLVLTLDNSDTSADFKRRHTAEFKSGEMVELNLNKSNKRVIDLAVKFIKLRSLPLLLCQTKTALLYPLSIASKNGSW